MTFIYLIFFCNFLNLDDFDQMKNVVPESYLQENNADQSPHFATTRCYELLEEWSWTRPIIIAIIIADQKM